MKSTEVALAEMLMGGSKPQPVSVKEFEDSPPASIDAYHGGSEPWFNVYYDTYHWLKSRVEYSPRMDNIFSAFKRLCSDELRWDSQYEIFIEFLEDTVGLEVEEPYTGFGRVSTRCCDSILKDEIEFGLFVADSFVYVLFRACSSPQVFELAMGDEAYMYDFDMGGTTIFCNECSIYWDHDGRAFCRPLDEEDEKGRRKEELLREFLAFDAEELSLEVPASELGERMQEKISNRKKASRAQTTLFEPPPVDTLDFRAGVAERLGVPEYPALVFTGQEDEEGTEVLCPYCFSRLSPGWPVV